MEIINPDYTIKRLGNGLYYLFSLHHGDHYIKKLNGRWIAESRSFATLRDAIMWLTTTF